MKNQMCLQQMASRVNEEIRNPDARPGRGIQGNLMRWRIIQLVVASLLAFVGLALVPMSQAGAAPVHGGQRTKDTAKTGVVSGAAGIAHRFTASNANASAQVVPPEFRDYTGTPGSISSPTDIATGPDGNLWFTNGGSNSIGRITTGGVVTDYTGTGINDPKGIAAGPDGNLWFTNYGTGTIGRITPGTGAVKIYTVPDSYLPVSIAAGPDDSMWFTNWGNDTIGRITMKGKSYNYPALSQPSGIAEGPDGAMWFTAGGDIGRITSTGAVHLYYDPEIASIAITAGPDGAMWFTNNLCGCIGRITTNGVFTTYTSTGVGTGLAITAGPDGALWFTNWGGSTIGRITTGGVVTDYADPYGVYADGITAGPDGALWFADQGQTVTHGESIGRITTGSYPTPTTTVLLPAVGAAPLSGSTYLDASASNATNVDFWLAGGSYGYGKVIGTATLTYVGWFYSWNTTTVPNGSYDLLSEALGAGGSAFSKPVSITVKN